MRNTGRTLQAIAHALRVAQVASGQGRGRHLAGSLHDLVQFLQGPAESDLSPNARIYAALKHVRNFRPTRLAPSPSTQITLNEPHLQGLHPTDAEGLHDTAAVLAGCKPAAYADRGFFDSPIGREMARRLQAAGHSIELHPHAPEGPDRPVAVGPADRVAELNHPATGARRTGELLGYPKEALDYFERRNSDMDRGIDYPYGSEPPAPTRTTAVPPPLPKNRATRQAPAPTAIAPRAATPLPASPPADPRHNPELDAMFADRGTPAKPAVGPAADPRHNPDLDSAFGMSPAGPAKSAPAAFEGLDAAARQVYGDPTARAARIGEPTPAPSPMKPAARPNSAEAAAESVRRSGQQAEQARADWMHEQGMIPSPTIPAAQAAVHERFKLKAAAAPAAPAAPATRPRPQPKGKTPAVVNLATEAGDPIFGPMDGHTLAMHVAHLCLDQCQEDHPDPALKRRRGKLLARGWAELAGRGQ